MPSQSRRPDPVRVSVVIPNKNGADMVGRCVEAALASNATEVVVVDDGSSDRSPAEAAAAGARVIPSPGRGFAAAVNAGAEATTGDALLVLNSDCFLAPDAVKRLGDALAADARLGICAAALVEPDGSPGKTHGPCLTLGLALRTVLSMNPEGERPSGRGIERVEFVPLACAAFRRSTWNDISGLDDRFFFYFEDQDVCRRLRDDGLEIAVDWDAVCVHVGGASSATRDRPRWFLQYVRSRARYLRKHYRRTWPVFAAVWVPTALVRALVWKARPGADSKAWARTWWTAAWAGIRG